MKRPPLSLRGQAPALLARREHSRAELRAMPLAHARKRPAWDAAEKGLAPDAFDAERGKAEVESLLDLLEAARHLSDARFAESRVHARAARHGAALIRQELARPCVGRVPATGRQLREAGVGLIGAAGIAHTVKRGGVR